jgi:Cellulose biosynthesis protein BcsS
MRHLLSRCVLIGTVGACTAVYAADMPIKGPPSVYKEAPDEPEAHIAPFAGADFTSQGYAFGFAGAIFAPYSSLETSGFRLYLHGASGVYKYITDSDTRNRGSEVSADLLFGWGFESDTYSINMFVGPNIVSDRIEFPDPFNPVQGTQVGVKGRTDWWINPTKQTLLAGEAEYGTAFHNYWVKSQFGFDITNGKEIFIGPEVIFLGDQRFDQWRVGAHLTALHFGKIDLALSGGYVHDSDFGGGGYGMLELSTKF